MAFELALLKLSRPGGTSYLSMIFSENRFPLFGIMLYLDCRQKQNCRQRAGRKIEFVEQSQPGWRAAQPVSKRRRQVAWRRPNSRLAAVLASARLAAALVRNSRSATRGISDGPVSYTHLRAHE